MALADQIHPARRQVEPSAIVLNFQRNLIFAHAQPDPHVRGLRVTHHIGERLLVNPVKRQARPLGEPFAVALQVEEELHLRVLFLKGVGVRTDGLFQSEEYRVRYADNLTKELPRIPRVKKVEDFRAFVDAGRRLGDLHVNYETVEPWPVTIRQGDLRTAVINDPEAFYRVTKMKFAGKRGAVDKATVIYNANITLQNIPLEAYDYVVNGKPALEWVMERQVVKTDTASGIVNDANRYAIETMNNPAYPLELFQRVITVSMETMKIVRSLPKLGELS